MPGTACIGMKSFSLLSIFFDYVLESVGKFPGREELLIWFLAVLKKFLKDHASCAGIRGLDEPQEAAGILGRSERPLKKIHCLALGEIVG